MIHPRWNLRRPAVLRPIVPTKAQEDELYRIYGDSIAIWQKLSSDLAAIWTKPELVTDAPDGQSVQWLVDQAQREADNTIIYQTEKLGRWVTKVGDWHGRKTIEGIKSATGVDIAPFIRLGDVREELQRSIRQNVALISSINADTKNRIQQIIFDGFAQRKTKKQITDELAKAMGITKRRARVIAGDQTHKLNIQLSAYRARQLGIKRYVWHTRLDDRVRPAHKAREGKVFRWDKPPPDGHPGYPIMCRCAAQSIIEDDDDGPVR